MSFDLETKEILLQLNKANKALAELKGIAQTIPNEQILLQCLGLQEAKGSSEIENIFTTHDELYQTDRTAAQLIASAAAKEVLRYQNAIEEGFELIRKKNLLTNKEIKQIQGPLEGNSAGVRSQAGTILKNARGEVVYTPPQDKDAIEASMKNLEDFINNTSLSSLDPLIKAAIIHHQFESIHPFYNGNGRTGRIILILFLVLQDLLDAPILYLSSYIIQNKGRYYQLLQNVRDTNNSEDSWRDWVLFILKGIEETAKETILLVKNIAKLMAEYKKILRPKFGRAYKHELINNLFFHPYTKIDYMAEAMQVGRQTASKYLDMIVAEGLLDKVKINKYNYYINFQLAELFMHSPTQLHEEIDQIESVHLEA